MSVTKDSTVSVANCSVINLNGSIIFMRKHSVYLKLKIIH